ncbi:MAG: oxygen-independent coproporphyrinogen III oxidase, partial [Verrucomicrobiota bacterium]
MQASAFIDDASKILKNRGVKGCVIDSELIQKYSQSGPRYTSYPSANHFKELDRHSSVVQHGKVPERPLSLYFHLPFCETLCWFCGCHTITTKNKSLADKYIDYLEKELALAADQSGPENEAVQLHFGGGTPNFLTMEQLRRLGALIHQHYRFSPDAEKSVELDPRRLSREQVETFASIGVHRASFGIQDCNPDVQQAIHRIQPEAMNLRAIQWLRDAGFQSVNVDLIYGLPGQNVESFRKTIEHVLSLKPDRIALFNYAHVPWMRPAQKLLERAGLPGQDLKIALFTSCIQQLTENGFEYIGMDHFARPGDELVTAQREGSLQRNFQGYSTRAGVDIRGFGISSISSNQIGFHQNTKDLSAYKASLDAG